MDELEGQRGNVESESEVRQNSPPKKKFGRNFIASMISFISVFCFLIMAPSYSKKRKVLDGIQGKTARPKKFRKQLQYHSSSEDEDQDDFNAVNLSDSDAEEDGGVTVTTAEQFPKKTNTMTSTATQPLELDADEKDLSEDEDAGEEKVDDIDVDEEEDDEGASDTDEDDLSDSMSATKNRKPSTKRNDPTAFSTSISKILSTKLPTSARSDPVLSRSKTAAQTTSDFANEKLDKQARAKLRAEKKEELDRGRVRDVMGIERGVSGPVAEDEKRLRKMAQRGVVKLFNAVRAAQIRGEEAAKGERKKGTVGMGEREKAVNEVSKQGFLELINGKKGSLNIEEA